MIGLSQLTFRCTRPPTYRRYVGCVLLGLLLVTLGCHDDTRTISVQTQPPGAKIFIDGKLAGFSPCKAQWKDARPDDLWELHVIEARTKGYESQRKEIRYRTGEAWLPEHIELTLVSTGGLVMQEDEEISTPSTPKTKTWTPTQEIPTSNANPPTPEVAGETPQTNAEAPQTQPAEAAAANPSERAFAIWRPKGRPAKTAGSKFPTPNSKPAEIDSAPVNSVVQTTAEPTPQGEQNFPASANPTKIILASDKVQFENFQTSGPNRLFACEVRLVRLSDGRVLGQASLLAPYSQRNQLADLLIKLLAKDAPDDANVAMGCLSNRRHGPDGQTLCDELTNAMVQAVRQTPGLRYVKQVNLRDVILDEEMIESPKIVADRRIAHLFTGADHVIVGGAALAVPIPRPIEEP